MSIILLAIMRCFPSFTSAWGFDGTVLVDQLFYIDQVFSAFLGITSILLVFSIAVWGGKKITRFF